MCRRSCGSATSPSSTTRTPWSAITERGVDLRIVVADNGGGGIFSFLPQASQLPADRFEQLFGTPHDTDIEALAAAHRVPAATVERADELVEAIARPGPSVTRVVTDRAENVRVHDELNAAVVAGEPRDGRGCDGDVQLTTYPVTPDDIDASRGTHRRLRASHAGDRNTATSRSSSSCCSTPDRSSRAAPSTGCSASPSCRHAGLIAASGGNHGAALAFVGRQLGMRVEIFMPSTSPAIKRANIERFGAAVTVIDGYYDDAQREVEKRQAETGALMVHPYDHADTVAGQGTMAKELEEQLGEFDTLGRRQRRGRLRRRPSGVVPRPGQDRQRRAGAVAVPASRHCSRASECRCTVGGIAADSLGAQLGAIPWAISRHFVDEAVLVSDDDIRAAQKAHCGPTCGWSSSREEPPPTRR